MKITGILFMILLIPCLTTAQVNTENLRADEKEGFSGNVSLRYGMAMGNSEYLSFTPAARIDYNTIRYNSFIAASYNRKQSELKKGREYLLAHKGFAHVRSARRFNSFLSWEVFGQWEFNEFISLERRLLGGTGARMNLLSRLFVPSIRLILGMGGMFEHEVYTAEDAKALWRSTNYITFNWNFSKQGSLHTTAYYQVAVAEPHDFRILSDSGLKFRLASWLVFGTSAGLRFDNDPIAGVVKKYDLELNNDLTVEF
ncbi:MAG: DUF481 domain-containing protein [Chitinispirillaceae bacterium]|nr:DUF481 domain-containing protein [Chitinispirillaceae bacterium]